jgi:hypothetical protein
MARRRQGETDGLHLQMLLRAGVVLGNIQTSARIGCHIPGEFTAEIPPRRGGTFSPGAGGTVAGT